MGPILRIGNDLKVYRNAIMDMEEEGKLGFFSEIQKRLMEDLIEGFMRDFDCQKEETISTTRRASSTSTDLR